MTINLELKPSDTITPTKEAEKRLASKKDILWLR